MLGWDSSNPLQYALTHLSRLCWKCVPCPELEQFSFKYQMPDWLSSSWMQPQLSLVLVIHCPGWKRSCFQCVFKRKLKIIICLFISFFFKNTEEIELLWSKGKVVGMAFGWCRWLLASFYIIFLSIFDCPWLVSIILGSLKRFCLFVLTLSLESGERGEIVM